jgi:hypothetical protein
VDKVRLNKFTCRLNDETVKQMEELLDSRYPRLKDKTTLISWLVADAWEEMKKGKEKSEGLVNSLGFMQSGVK